MFNLILDINSINLRKFDFSSEEDWDLEEAVSSLDLSEEEDLQEMEDAEFESDENISLSYHA